MSAPQATEVITALEKALEAGPKSGPWRIDVRGKSHYIRSGDGSVIGTPDLTREVAANGAFIAAANPLAIRTLLDAHASALRDAEKLREALKRITAIEDCYSGTDWQEIEEAREIARSALDDNTKGGGRVSGFHNVNGDPVDFAALHAAGAEQRRRSRAAGIAQGRKPTVKKGYAAQPGTGPEGMTCKGCKHKTTLSNTGKKSWIKCELRRSTWTGGEGADIKTSSPACYKFEPKEPT